MAAARNQKGERIIRSSLSFRESVWSPEPSAIVTIEPEGKSEGGVTTMAAATTRTSPRKNKKIFTVCACLISGILDWEVRRRFGLLGRSADQGRRGGYRSRQVVESSKLLGRENVGLAEEV